MSEVVTELVKTEPEVETKEELVSKKVLDEYKADFFKQKEAKKALEAENQRLKDQQALREKDELVKNEQWKQLYETEKTEKAKAQAELLAKSEFFVNSSKVNAVVQKLGGFKKDAYTKFIDTSKIDLREDGTFDTDSINREVDRVKQEHPELLAVGPASGKMPSNAPTNISSQNTNDLSKLSTAELLKLATQKSLKG